MEALRTSTIYRRLETKLQIMGLEAHDLLFTLLFAAILNLFFGQTDFGTYLIFTLPPLLIFILYFGKRGKPEGHLNHFLRFYLTPGFYSASKEPQSIDQLRRKIKYDK